MMIKADNVWKKFENQDVLKGLNLTVAKGEVFVIIGQSGCGKSVFLKLLTRLLEPDQGNIYVEGEDIINLNDKELRKLRMKFGFVFQNAALFDSLNVFENVSFGLTQHTDLSQDLISDRVSDCLKLVGLQGIEEKMPAELSGGMKKRIAIARAVVLNPQIILYDEPTTGLDPVVASSINHLIKKLKREVDATSIVVTHDMNSSYFVADRIGMLYEGKIIEVNDSEGIKNSSSPVVQQFINGNFEGPIKI